MNLKTDKYTYEGKVINLRPVVKEDYTVSFLRWSAEEEFSRYLSHGQRTTTEESMEQMADDLAQKENTIFAIVDPTSEQTIGIVGLHQFNRANDSCEYAIHIGEKKFWGAGVACEATDYILDYAFNTLNFQKVWLGVNEPNQRAYKFYLKKGFMEEGRLRNEFKTKDGTYYDVIRMGILRSEYDQK